MRITIGQNTEKNMQVLGIDQYPFDSMTLKKNYRDLLLINHPDKSNGNKDKAKEVTIKILKAYKELKNLAIDVEQKDLDIEVDEDMFSLKETCKDCKGQGKIFHTERKMPCPCSFTSRNFFLFLKTGSDTTCKDCHGTGKFKQARSKRVVTCRRCKGKGRIVCPLCHGIGYKSKPMGHITCSRCEGTGKIELKPFNPVIPKGGVL